MSRSRPGVGSPPSGYTGAVVGLVRALEAGDLSRAIAYLVLVVMFERLSGERQGEQVLESATFVGMLAPLLELGLLRAGPPS